MFDCITGFAVVTHLRAWQIGLTLVAVSWVAPSPAPPGGYYVVVESANLSANVRGTLYNATVPPGRHTIQVLPFSPHYPSEAVSVEVTVHEIGKGYILSTFHSWDM